MDAYHPKRRISLSFAGWKGREYVAAAFGGDASLRQRLMQEPGAVANGSAVYLPADGFVLADFFDRYVGDAFIDYSAIKAPQPEPVRPSRPDLPPGYLEKLRQVRYSDHTVTLKRILAVVAGKTLPFTANTRLDSFKACSISPVTSVIAVINKIGRAHV